MATCSSILVWRIPWTEEPGGLQSVGPRSSADRLNDNNRVSWSVSQECFREGVLVFSLASPCLPWTSSHCPHLGQKASCGRLSRQAPPPALRADTQCVPGLPGGLPPALLTSVCTESELTQRSWNRCEGLGASESILRGDHLPAFQIREALNPETESGNRSEGAQRSLTIPVIIPMLWLKERRDALMREECEKVCA